MSGIPIRIRRTLTDTPESPSLGEMFLHLGQNKFGLYNGTAMLWYPGIDPLTKTMRMNEDQRLTGFDSDGTATVMLSFDTPNALTIVTLDGTILAQFDSTGVSFNNPLAQSPLGGGNLNRLVHPGFLPGLFSSAETQISAAGEHKWLGPNTLMFRGTGMGTMGSFSVSRQDGPGSGQLTHEVAEPLSLRVRVDTNLGQAGIRMWLTDFNLGYYSDVTKNKNRFFISVKGPLGKTSFIRVGKNGTYSYVPITGTGMYQRYAVDIPQHTYLNSFVNGGMTEPYAIDVLYNAEAGEWFINEPTMQCVDSFADEIYQYRSFNERMQCANALWYEPIGIKMYGTESEYVNLPCPLPIYNDPYFTYSVETVFSTYPVVVENKTARGFEVRTSTSNSANWKYQPRVMAHGALTDIL